jgi:predicted N-acetyltransferase YhbS
MTVVPTHGAALADVKPSFASIFTVPVGAVRIGREATHEAPAREALLDRAFGAGRHTKTSARMRVGRLPANGLSLVARDGDSGRLLGTVRLWDVALGGAAGEGDGRAALMLGPLAVDREAQGFGIGTKLMRFAIAEAAFRGAAAIILVGDPGYYASFGFTSALTADLRLPGPVEQHRFLGLELRPGTLGQARGLVRPTGAMARVGAGSAEHTASGAAA